MWSRLGSRVPGPIEPATNRGRASVLWRSAAARAIWAARLLISWHSVESPNSPSTQGAPPKELVSTMSAPTSKYRLWMASMTSGRVRHRISEQFSRPL